ncbi:vanadium-dependent haloperoxidase [Lysobacter sp. FW306-1B-D06B]|uniref:vanadium-dependent haloperoxidase n=1 Tax=Lysobacter sp. FW306-1B-D06B TaxID=3140250 RepID=UPI00313FF5E1
MNSPRSHSRRALRRLRLFAALALSIALPVQADSVTDWNALASGPVVGSRFGGPQQQARAVAIAALSVHDALNSIQSRFNTYRPVASAPGNASPDAAVAAANRTALLAMIGALPAPPTPAEATARANAIAAINAMYDAAIGPGAPDAPEAAGIAAGESAADTIIALRYADNGSGGLTPTDGSGTPNAPAYSQPAAVGVYQATPAPEFPAAIVPQFMGWAFVTPFGVDSATQFRQPPGAIFKVKAAKYASEYNLVKSIGDARARGAQPNSPLSDIARFWAGGGLEWNANVRNAAASRGLDRWQNARLLALANMSIADAFITNMSDKYFYNFWRPVTAIRWPDDGNPFTKSDPTWRPFLQTPPYPDYPCASTSATGAAAQTMRRYFKSDAVPFTRMVNAPVAPLPPPLVDLPAKPITRSYPSLSTAEQEQVMARVYAGIHFTEGCLAGLKTGNKVADWVFARYLQPK